MFAVRAAGSSIPTAAEAAAALVRALAACVPVAAVLDATLGGDAGVIGVGSAAVPDVPAGGVATAVDGGLLVHAGSDDVPVTVVVETAAHGPEQDRQPPDHDDREEIVDLASPQADSLSWSASR
ncbi:hypothetical protein SAMN05216377_11555 [Pseudonocardia oroxyli]|uniref:Uncharacterized protein n=2 Tax=Pseudonocardia oroxyli TaxID=366584 RepID=A0A1G7X1L7_PSEOR|nr:hypothetical protein SAMN05216377_11555 [Pseudonocardia oroxyli]